MISKTVSIQFWTIGHFTFTIMIVATGTIFTIRMVQYSNDRHVMQNSKWRNKDSIIFEDDLHVR